MSRDELRNRLGCPAVTSGAPMRVVRPLRVLGIAALRERSREIEKRKVMPAGNALEAKELALVYDVALVALPPRRH